MTWGNHYTREHDEYLAERRELESHVQQINRQIQKSPNYWKTEADALGWNREHYRKFLKETGDWWEGGAV